MGIGVGRIGFAAACLMWLAGCETTSNLDNPFRKLTDPLAPQTETTTPGADVTGSVDAAPPPELLGSDPSDDLSIGKKYFRQGSYGIAEGHFRKAVERHPRDAEAWVGLAASYDRLRRFDLADRAYAQAIRILGPTPEILNNQGFSYLLRGDFRRARETLQAARAKDPDNPYIRNNLKLLEASMRRGKEVH
jgi:Flp pilus assembly protein TadD